MGGHPPSFPEPPPPPPPPAPSPSPSPLTLPPRWLKTPCATGIIPLSFVHIFERIAATPEAEFLVRVSYIEIYNEEVRAGLGRTVALQYCSSTVYQIR
jgi:hypothetical protein